MLTSLYALTISDAWFVSADSALYLMLADNLATGDGYTLWGSPHLHVPPGLPGLLALLRSVGLTELWVLHALQACCALAVCGLAYLFYRAAGKGAQLAAWVAIAVALNHQLVVQAGMILSELELMVCVTAALACYAHARPAGVGCQASLGWLVAAALLLLAGVVFRVAGAPLLLGAVLGTWLERRQLGTRRVAWHAALLLGLLLVAGAICVTYYGRANPDGQLESYAGGMTSILDRGLGTQFASYWQHLQGSIVSLSRLLTGQSFSGVPGLSLLPTLLVAVGMGSAVREGRSLGVALAVVYVGTLLVHEPLSPRYLLPLLPLWTWYACLGVGSVAQAAGKLARERQPTRLVRWAVVAAMVLAGANFPKTLRTIYQRHGAGLSAWDHSFAIRCYHPRPEICGPALEIANYFRQHGTAGDRFVEVHYPQQPLFHRPIAYLGGMDSLPIVQSGIEWRDPSYLDQWIAQGTNYVIVRSPSVRAPDQGECAIRRSVIENRSFQRVLANERYELYHSAALTSDARAQRAESSSR